MTDRSPPGCSGRFHGHAAAPTGYPVASERTHRFRVITATDLRPGGAGPPISEELRRHIDLLIVFQHRTYIITGTLQQCEQGLIETANLQLARRLVELYVIAFAQLDRIDFQCARYFTFAPAHQTARSVWPASHLSTDCACTGGLVSRPSAAVGQRYWDDATWTHWPYNGSH
jgi:hypothetical protein